MDTKLPIVRPLTVDDRSTARFSPDGGRLAVGGSEPCGTLWATASLEKVADLTLPAGCPTSFVFSPDGATLLTTVWQSQGLALRDARGGTQLVRHGRCLVGDDEMGDGDPADVLAAGLSDDGAHVFVGTLGGDVCVWPHPGAGSTLISRARQMLSRSLSSGQQARLPVQPTLLR